MLNQFTNFYNMLLQPNLNWNANCGIELPTVFVTTHATEKFLQVTFSVTEPINCFRAEICKDNDRSWEDSCVEVFLQPANASEYFNFEITSRGYILAAIGKDRFNRKTLLQTKLDKILRNALPPIFFEKLVSWKVSIQIPAEILGIKKIDKTLKGNFYKCADKAKTPHYLSAFKIETAKPDFHRPEFFKEIF